MYRRLWTGLPEDPVFPEDLEKLGYFVNEEDEIRKIEDPRYYFKFFINRNMHWNDRQRFAFNIAVQRLVHSRLAELGLQPVRLPLGARADESHVTVLATADIVTAARIVLFVGETAQDLGILAHRVVSGAGGINKGSLVSMVQGLRAGRPAGRNTPPPAILIFNPGELFWWPEGKRTLSLPSRQGMPRPSAAHYPPRTVAGINEVPGHATADEHVASVFRALLGPLARHGTDGRLAPRLTAIALAGGADALEGFLDQTANWQRWGPHMDSLVLLGGLYEAADVQTDGFRAFLRKRARAYIASTAPVDMPVSGPDGNDQTTRTTHFGCPVHSSGTMWLTELMFIDAQEAILAWGEAVAGDSEYENPHIQISYADEIQDEGKEAWGRWMAKKGEEGGDNEKEKGEKEEMQEKEKNVKEEEDEAHSDGRDVQGSTENDQADQVDQVDQVDDKNADKDVTDGEATDKLKPSTAEDVAVSLATLAVEA